MKNLNENTQELLNKVLKPEITVAKSELEKEITSTKEFVDKFEIELEKVKENLVKEIDEIKRNNKTLNSIFDKLEAYNKEFSNNWSNLTLAWNEDDFCELRDCIKKRPDSTYLESLEKNLTDTKFLENEAKNITLRNESILFNLRQAEKMLTDKLSLIISMIPQQDYEATMEQIYDKVNIVEELKSNYEFVREYYKEFGNNFTVLFL